MSGSTNLVPGISDQSFSHSTPKIIQSFLFKAYKSKNRKYEFYKRKYRKNLT